MLRIIDQYRFDEIDPFFSTVVHLAHFDGANGSTTITNSCPRGNTMTAGAGTISTALSVFGGASLRRDVAAAGTAAASAALHADYKFGSNDLTIEFWFRIAVVAQRNIFDMRIAASGSNVVLYIEADGRLKVFSTSDRITAPAGTIAANTFYLIAYSRVSGTGRLFVGGVQKGSNYTDSTNYTDNAGIIMGSTNANPDNSNWDDLRVSNGLYGAGAGRYAANYSIPTAAFPDS